MRATNAATGALAVLAVMLFAGTPPAHGSLRTRIRQVAVNMIFKLPVMLAVMMINSLFVSPDPIQSSSCPPLPALGRAGACVGLDAVAEQQVWHQAASKRPVFIYTGSLVFSSGGAYKQRRNELRSAAPTK